jgi:hypothetical protein
MRMSKHFVFEIEAYDGNTIMAFEVAVSGDELEIVRTLDCDHADTDNDYIFETEADLYRIQSDHLRMEE